ncbi:hypothetical protein THIOM_001778, partial [Candidatus Thiomargarita nelsonii]
VENWLTNIQGQIGQRQKYEHYLYKERTGNEVNNCTTWVKTNSKELGFIISKPPWSAYAPGNIAGLMGSSDEEEVVHSTHRYKPEENKGLDDMTQTIPRVPQGVRGGAEGGGPDVPTTQGITPQTKTRIAENFRLRKERREASKKK